MGETVVANYSRHYAIITVYYALRTLHCVLCGRWCCRLQLMVQHCNEADCILSLHTPVISLTVTGAFEQYVRYNVIINTRTLGDFVFCLNLSFKL